MSRTTAGKRSTRAGPLILGLGSNLGDSEARLRWAISKLRARLGPTRVAPLYRSAPLSPIDQPDFLNTVIAIEPSSHPAPGPEDVLQLAQALEREGGRIDGERWGPRTLDVDLLLWGDLQLDRPELTVPHPRLRQRRFVLAPLVDLLPDLPLPPDRLPARQALLELGEAQRVERLSWTREP